MEWVPLSRFQICSQMIPLHLLEKCSIVFDGYKLTMFECGIG